ncbi:MAG: DNA polymerase IV [Gammaproteobacteria bacterium]
MLSNDYWPRAIVLVDMNAFFASIEQHDDPVLYGRPVAVTNGLTGTCIITCSYEARRHGIYTGMRIRQARRLCPGLVQRPARPQRYARVSTHIMAALHAITPDIEVFSVDEAFLDITRCQRLWGAPEAIAGIIRQKVFEVSGVPCSIGISGDKTTAKYAAKQQKPNGLTLIPPWQARERLRDVPVTELCGINTGIGAFLAKRGVFTCGDMEKLPISVLGQRFGNPGRRIWQMCRGEDPDRVQNNINSPKSIGHGKVLPPNTKDRDVIYMYLIHMAEKVAARLRRHAMQAQKYFVGLRSAHGWIGNKFKTATPTNDSKAVIRLCKTVLSHYWNGEGIFQVQVTAQDPRLLKSQIDFLAEDDAGSWRLNRAMDLINERFGEFTVAPAQLLDRSDMPNVIAPAWKPCGHRQTIPNTRSKHDQLIVKKIYKINS